MTEKGHAGTRVYQIEEVAEMLGLSESTVLRACDDGDLRSIRVRSKRLILRDWLDSQLAAKPAPEGGEAA